MENIRKCSSASELQWRSLPRSLGLRLVLGQGNFRGCGQKLVSHKGHLVVVSLLSLSGTYGSSARLARMSLVSITALGLATQQRPVGALGLSVWWWGGLSALSKSISSES